MTVTDADRAIIIKSSLIAQKTTRTSNGNLVINLKKGQKVVSAISNPTEVFGDLKGYRKLKLPATGVLLAEKDIQAMQLKIDE